MEIKNTSTFRLLFFLRLILEREMTKNEIVDEFKSEGISLNKPSINRYIAILEDNGIKINISKKKNQVAYKINKESSNLKFSPIELQNLQSIKKCLLAYKDYNLIRRVMRLFYKVAALIDDTETKLNLIDFGYYSKINWVLVKELEKLAKTKAITEIEYISKGIRKDKILQLDSITTAKLSDRLYIDCVLDGDNKMSHLPIDKIFVIKKVIKEVSEFNLEKKKLTYRVKESDYFEIEQLKNERIIKKDNGYLTIEIDIEDEFSLIQRLLYFSPSITEISDPEIKAKVLDKLNKIKAQYETK